MMVLAYWFAARYHYPVEEVFRLSRLWHTFKDAAWAFLLPVIILGGIFGGLVTATEGAGLAVEAPEPEIAADARGRTRDALLHSP